MLSRQETARPLLTAGEVMQLPATDELVLVSGIPPIRAKKVRYFEDKRLATRVLHPAPNSPGAGTSGGRSAHTDDWSKLPLLGCSLSAEDGSVAGSLGEDGANGGIRREPTIPRHEAIAPEELNAEAEFALLGVEPTDAGGGKSFSKHARSLARQAALDPADGLGL